MSTNNPPPPSPPPSPSPPPPPSPSQRQEHKLFPLPWRCGYVTAVDSCDIIDATGRVVRHNVDARTAAFIVTACNSHAALVAERDGLKTALLSAECTLSNLLNDAKAGRPFGPYAVEGLTLALNAARAQLEARA